MSGVAALALAASADPHFALPFWLVEQLESTVLALWARDSAASLWPWRGWRSFEATPDLVRNFELCETFDTLDPSSSGVAHLRNTLRTLILVWPLGRADDVLLRRTLGALAEDVAHPWARALRRLRPAAPYTRCDDDEGCKLLDAEATLAAFDPSVRPSFLLVLQAALPFPPTLHEQHSLHALAELVHRLSSGVNARAARQLASGPADTVRFTSFIDGGAAVAAAATAEAAAGNHSDEDDETDGVVRTPWKSTVEATPMTAMETQLSRVVQAVSAELAQAFGERYDLDSSSSNLEPALQSTTSTITGPRTGPTLGRPPTDHERRTAFLQLFGARHVFSVNPSPAEIGTTTSRYFSSQTSTASASSVQDGSANLVAVAAMLAGDSNEPVVAQLLSGDAANDDENTKIGFDATHQFVTSGVLHDAAKRALLGKLHAGVEVRVPSPPVGFIWRGLKSQKSTVTIRVESKPFEPCGTGSGIESSSPTAQLRFWANEIEVPIFDGAALLDACGSPLTVPIPPDLEALIKEAIYCNPSCPNSGAALGVSPLNGNSLSLFHDLEQYAADARVASGTTMASESTDMAGDEVTDDDDHLTQVEPCCYEWFALGQSSELTRGVWRDAVVKIATRERGTVEIASVDKNGGRVQAAVQGMSEGTLLRLFYALQSLYPSMLRRTGELRFAVCDEGGAFAHCMRMLSLLAFGVYDDGARFLTAAGEGTSEPEIRSIFPSENSSIPATGSGSLSHGSVAAPSRLVSRCAELQWRKETAASQMNQRPALLCDDSGSDSESGSAACEHDDCEAGRRKATSSRGEEPPPLHKRLSLNLGALPDGGHGTLRAAPWRVASDAAQTQDRASLSQKPASVVEDAPCVTTTLWPHQREVGYSNPEILPLQKS
jgi:hypothetical protein